MSANVVTGRCGHDCSTTWAVFHGGALPGGPWPGHRAHEGDVRRCDHGRLWIFDGCLRPYTLNHWRRLSPVTEPVLYRRAARALAAPPVTDTEAGRDA